MQKKNFLENLWESLSNLDKAKAGSYALFIPEFVVMYVLMRYVPAYKTGNSNVTLPWMVVIPVRSYAMQPPTKPTRFASLSDVASPILQMYSWAQSFWASCATTIPQRISPGTFL